MDCLVQRQHAVPYNDCFTRGNILVLLRAHQSKPTGGKDRVRSDIEYEVNIKAEFEIAHLHEMTDRIYENMMARFSSLKKQMAANRSLVPDPNRTRKRYLRG